MKIDEESYEKTEDNLRKVRKVRGKMRKAMRKIENILGNVRKLMKKEEIYLKYL